MTPEQQALLRLAGESLAAGRLLLEQGYARFAASRAYYAMFYAAQALLLQHELSFSKHSAVIATFGKEFTKTGRLPTELHRYMIEAEDLRHDGDYDPMTHIEPAAVQEQLTHANVFLDAATRFLANQ